MLRIYVTLKNDTMRCTRHGLSTHPGRLWRIKRRVVDTFGHFNVVRINGEEHVIDLSLPVELDRVPMGATLLSTKQTEELWHSETGSHVFGE